MRKLNQHIAFKSLSGIVLLLLLFSAVVSVIGYRGYTESMLSLYSDDAFLLAEAAAGEVDADRLDEWLSSGGGDAQWQETWEKLDRMCNDFRVTFIYVIAPDRSDWGHIRFIFSTVDHESSYSPYAVGFVRETSSEEYRQKYRRLYEEGSERELLLRNGSDVSTSGHHITAMVPLRGADGTTRGILCVERRLNVLSQARNAFVHKVITAMLVFMLLVLVGQGAYLGRVLLEPLRRISEEAGRFARENALPERKLTDDIQNRDEVGSLADAIDRMEEQITAYIAEIGEVTAEKERVKTELSLAARIQLSMLPDAAGAFPERGDFRLDASMDPAREVGGDFYDFFLIDDDHLCISIADVSGKGVPAALMMMAAKILLASFAVSGKSPAEILAATNDAICSNNAAQMFVTVWLGILELSTGTLTAANAGHEYPAIRHSGGAFELLKDRHGLVLGAMENLRYRDYTIRLEPGAKIFVYTDGVPEAMGPNEELFGTGRMLAALGSCAGLSPREILARVRGAVDAFAAGTEQYDDLTMLCLEYRGGASGQITITSGGKDA